MPNQAEIRILHVDDDRDDHVLVRDLLLGGLGPVRYRIDWLSTYEEALACTQLRTYDVFLFDYDLGANSGMDLMRAVQAADCKAPVIILTGAGDLAVDLQALKAGAMDYLDKNQLNFPLLDRSVRYALTRKRHEDMLWSIQGELERRVLERTRELQQTNAELRREAAERIQAQTELSHSQAYFRAILDGSPDLILILRSDGTVQFCSGGAMRLLGRPPGTLEQQSLLRWVHPDDAARLRELFARLTRREPVQLVMECRMQHQQGQWVDFELTGEDYRDNPAVQGIVVNARDITRRRKAEQTLRDSDRRYRDLVEGSIQGILIHRDLKPLFANRAAAGLLGYESPWEVCATPSLAALFPPGPGADQFRHPAGQPGAEENADTSLFQFHGLRRDGQERIFYGASRAIIWDGAPAVQATLIDVTEVLLLEGQLRQAQKMEALGVLVAGIAHEVNNPNSYILLNTSTLGDIWTALLPILEQYDREVAPIRCGSVDFAFLRTRIPTLTAAITDGSRRIKQIVEGLSDFARQDEGGDTQEVNLNDVIGSALPIIDARIRQATNRFALELAPQLPVIKGTSQRLQQVVMNLLLNACDALPSPDRAITVRTHLLPEAHEVLLEVADQGCGIAPQNLARVCDPFFTTKPMGKGTGLGMSVSAGIVRQHSGRMELHSIPGGGTTVAVYFPCREPSTQAAEGLR